jgi:hypothetical protein
MALSLADAGDIEAMSMRKIARALLALRGSKALTAL